MDNQIPGDISRVQQNDNKKNITQIKTNTALKDISESEEKKSRIRKSKEERIAEKKAELEKAKLKAIQIQEEIKRLQQDPEVAKKETSRRKFMAGFIALKMIRKKQEFNRETFKVALLENSKSEADKIYFENIFHD